jgi:hypothetical protein
LQRPIAARVYCKACTTGPRFAQPAARQAMRTTRNSGVTSLRDRRVEFLNGCVAVFNIVVVETLSG